MYFKLSYLLALALILFICVIGIAWEHAKPPVIDYFKRLTVAYHARRLMRERAKRDADARKWGLVPFYPTKERYIPPANLDRATTTGQFRGASTITDIRGVTR